MPSTDTLRLRVINILALSEQNSLTAFNMLVWDVFRKTQIISAGSLGLTCCDEISWLSGSRKGKLDPKVKQFLLFSWPLNFPTFFILSQDDYHLFCLFKLHHLNKQTKIVKILKYEARLLVLSISALPLTLAPGNEFLNRGQTNWGTCIHGGKLSFHEAGMAWASVSSFADACINLCPA